MKILTASKGYIPRMRAHLMKFPDSEHHYIFDNDEQRRNAMVVLGLSARRCHVASTPQGIGQDGVAFVRQWAEQNLTGLNEWYVWLDDNVSHFTWLPTPWYDLEKIDFDFDWNMAGGESVMAKCCYEFREAYNTPCPPETVEFIWNDTIVQCEKRGTVAGGFAIETNYFFRSRKWQYFGYVRCQCGVFKNTGLPWYYWPGCMLEDFVRSVDVVSRYGGVVINRFMKPHKPFFEAGGIGSFEERKPNLVAVNQELMRRYPGLLRLNKGQDYQLTFAIHTEKRIREWMEEHPQC